MRAIGRADLRAPAAVLDIDVADPSNVDLNGVTGETAWCLIRNSGVPVDIKFFDISGAGHASREQLLASLTDASQAQADGGEAERWSGHLTVVICTIGRASGLKAALRSLLRQTDPDFDVLVVDNSSDQSAREVVECFEGLSLAYCHEPVKGLSHARNRALNEARSEVVAWLDDDELADAGWVQALRRGFAHPGGVAAVCGLMLPAELKTTAQVNFERYGGFNKGRGVHPEVLSLDVDPELEPLFPLPNFGAGGNMAFRLSVARELRGFDTRLGAGTLTHGGEETQMLARVLLLGETILHWPEAITWHYHRETEHALERQFYGYAAGLTAFYVSMVIWSPRCLMRIARLIPKGIARILASRSPGSADGPPPNFPASLSRASRKGLLMGALLYCVEWWRQRGARTAALPSR